MRAISMSLDGLDLSANSPQVDTIDVVPLAALQAIGTLIGDVENDSAVLRILGWKLGPPGIGIAPLGWIGDDLGLLMGDNVTHFGRHVKPR